METNKIAENGLAFIETSALDSSNVEPAFQKILTGAFLPSASLFSDISRFVDHTIMETTGIDTSNPRKTPEQVMKEAQPIKNAAKMFPFTKSLVTWMAIIDPEFAKEYDVTIQKQSRR
jgi:hypothetical protein